MLGLHEKWRSTLMEFWPDEVIALGLPMEQATLSERDQLAMSARTAGFREMFELDEIPPFTARFYAAVNDTLAVFPSGGHARLGGCSFKKPGLFQTAPAFNGRELTPYILQENPRVTGLLANSLQDNFDVGLFIRPWHDIPQWAEFRLFMKNRAFMGASRYFHQMVFPEIEIRAKPIAAALIDFANRFSFISHLDDGIIDVFVQNDADNSWRAILIDINPLIRRADACLFRWQNGGAFDLGLRFRGPDGRVLSIAPLPSRKQPG